MSDELFSFLQPLITIPDDLIRLYPGDNNLHIIAHDMADKINALQVKILQTEKEKEDAVAEVKRLQKELQQLKNKN